MNVPCDSPKCFNLRHGFRICSLEFAQQVYMSSLLKLNMDSWNALHRLLTVLCAQMNQCKHNLHINYYIALSSEASTKPTPCYHHTCTKCCYISVVNEILQLWLWQSSQMKNTNWTIDPEAAHCDKMCNTSSDQSFIYSNLYRYIHTHTLL